jgi:hypothetical protein
VRYMVIEAYKQGPRARVAELGRMDSATRGRAMVERIVQRGPAALLKAIVSIANTGPVFPGRTS